jgi:hypothetical protein
VLDLLVVPLEKSMEVPFNKPDLPNVLGELGFELSSDSNDP